MKDKITDKDKFNPSELTTGGQFGRTFEYIWPEVHYLKKTKIKKTK